MKLGELLVSLTYLPAKNTLTIGVLKARNLKAKDINGKSGKSAVFYCIAGPWKPLNIGCAHKYLTPNFS